MGTLETRYRDVPFDDVAGCHTDTNDGQRWIWEEECRGQPITLFTPPIPERLVNEGFVYENSGHILSIGPAPPCSSGCRGPFYGILGFEGTVCGHWSRSATESSQHRQQFSTGHGRLPLNIAQGAKNIIQYGVFCFLRN